MGCAVLFLLLFGAGLLLGQWFVVADSPRAIGYVAAIGLGILLHATYLFVSVILIRKSSIDHWLTLLTAPPILAQLVQFCCGFICMIGYAIVVSSAKQEGEEPDDRV